METMQFYDWKFQVDRYQTRQFYQRRNKAVHSVTSDSKELNDFITFLGIDLQRPVSVSPDGYAALFLVCGEAASDDEYEIDLRVNQHNISLVIYPGDACGQALNGNTFGMEIQNFTSLCAL
jgi:hypothetical protein